VELVVAAAVELVELLIFLIKIYQQQITQLP
jgi:hypothetical protein